MSIMFVIGDVKSKIQVLSSTEEMLFYSSSEKKKIYKNWLNHLYLAYGLGQDRKEIGN